MNRSLTLACVMMAMMFFLSGCGAFMAVTGLGYLLGYETKMGIEAVGAEVDEFSEERQAARQARRESIAEVVYKEGEVIATVTKSTRHVWHAARVVLAREGWTDIEGDTPKKTGKLTAFDDDGEKIIIKFTKLSEEQSQVGLRIGLKGDVPRSDALLDKIVEYVETSNITVP